MLSKVYNGVMVTTLICSVSVPYHEITELSQPIKTHVTTDFNSVIKITIAISSVVCMELACFGGMYGDCMGIV